MTPLEWMKKLSQTECSGASHHDLNHPLILEKALGSQVWDVEGTAYLDACCGFGTLPLGHRDPSVWNALGEFDDDRPLIVQGMGDVYPTRAKIDLLAAIQKRAPKPGWKAMLTVTGSQAVEAAIRTAFLATKRIGVASFEGSYHGTDLGVLGATGMQKFKGPFERVCSAYPAIQFDYGGPLGPLTKALDRGDLACVVVEPIQGRSGVRVPPKGWLEDLCNTCHSRDTLVIYDEILTGWGRLGRWTMEDPVPDLTCLGKALGGGMPLSACLGHADLMAAWPENDGESIHTGTYFGHGLSCQIGLETQRQLEERSLVPLVARETFKSRITEGLKGTDGVGTVLGQGLLVAIDLERPGAGVEAVERLRQIHRVLALPTGQNGQCIGLTPAFNLTTEEENHLVEALVDVCGHDCR